MLAENWKYRPIRNFAHPTDKTVQTGPFGAQLHSEDYVDEGVPFILIKNMKGEHVSQEDMPCITEQDAKRLAAYRLNAGDIVFSRVGRVGSCFLVSEEEEGWVISGQLLRLRLDYTELCPKFLLHWIRSFYVERHILNESVGSTRQSINSSILANLPVPNIPKDEQIVIANILDTLDTKIRQTEAIIAKLQQVKQGLLHDLLTRGINESGQLRPPYEQAPELYKDSPLGWIPKEWEVLRLATLSENGLSNGVFKEPKRVGKGVPLINVADLYRGDRLALEACELFDASPGEVKRYGARKGDIFYTRSSLKLEGIAQTSYLNSETKSAVYECHVMRLRPNKNLVFPRYLKEWCVGSFARKHFMEHAKQVTMTTISQDGIAGLLCPKPDLDEQEKCVAMIESHESRILKELNLVKKLKKQKAGLMDDLLTGRVRVTELIEQQQQAS